MTKKGTKFTKRISAKKTTAFSSKGYMTTTTILHHDDPLRRMIETERDIRGRELAIGKIRLEALAQAQRMPISDDGSLSSLTEDYLYSQVPVTDKSNWLQIGPTAIPNGQTTSTYYWDSNIPALATGRITSIVIDPDNTNVIYVGTALGGVWKTIDGGRNWRATSDYAPSLGIGALVMDPNNRNVLYAGTGEGNLWYETEAIGISHPDNYYGCGILKTIDAGGRWILINKDNNPFLGTSFFRLAINPSDSSRIFAATADGLFGSNNAGETWIHLAKGLPSLPSRKLASTDVVINPRDPNIVFTAFRRLDNNDKVFAGVYKSTQANEMDPLWKKLDINDDIDISKVTRISLTISKTHPNILYALMTTGGMVDRFYRLEDDNNGTSKWERIPLPSKKVTYNELPNSDAVWEKDSIGGQGTYNLNVAVDPENSNIVYLSGISLWKAVRDTNKSKWEILDIGKPIHPDHHAFAFDPHHSYIIYAGSDGGIYKSINGGETWSDTINEGLCITQFEFMDHHPTSDAVIFGGTQDNGTLQYRNSPAFYFSDYGDGGFVSVDKDNANNIVHQYIQSFLYHSNRAGQMDSWKRVSVVDGKSQQPLSLFYAPFVLDRENTKNIAFGSNRIFLDTNQGLNGWKTFDGNENSIELDFLDPGIQGKKPAELVSAIDFVKSDLIYAGTTDGKVIRAASGLDGWKAHQISKPSDLPSLYIWDVCVMPNDPNIVIVVMAGFGSEAQPPSLIWRGTSQDNGISFKWESINGDEGAKLPSTPINALIIDNKLANNIYIGTDIGVFYSSNSGKSWIRFSENLPICSVYDMRLLNQPKVLRIATHGRGMWERHLEAQEYKDVNLFVRNHVMDRGWIHPCGVAISAFSDPLQNEEGGTKLNDLLTWDMCPDIKIDAPWGDPPMYQVDAIESVDYVKFESRLQHRSPKRGAICNIYVQIHDRGANDIVENVTIKILYANMLENGKYPDLPKDFWLSTLSKSEWKPIATRKLPEGSKTLTNTEPTVVALQWYVPQEIGKQAGILVIIESPQDTISSDGKIFNVEKLVKIERHAGLRTIAIKD